MSNFFKKLRKRLEKKRKKLFKGPLEEERRSKGEMPKCKTCISFRQYSNFELNCPLNIRGKTMKMACDGYKRKM